MRSTQYCMIRICSYNSPYSIGKDLQQSTIEPPGNPRSKNPPMKSIQKCPKAKLAQNAKPHSFQNHAGDGVCH